MGSWERLLFTGLFFTCLEQPGRKQRTLEPHGRLLQEKENLKFLSATPPTQPLSPQRPARKASLALGVATKEFTLQHHSCWNVIPQIWANTHNESPGAQLKPNLSGKPLVCKGLEVAGFRVHGQGRDAGVQAGAWEQASLPMRPAERWELPPHRTALGSARPMSVPLV